MLNREIGIKESDWCIVSSPLSAKEATA